MMPFSLSSSPCFNNIEKRFLECKEKIETWFIQAWEKSPPPIYGSVDLRNAGFKIAPVDMNLFPAGFNNLNKSCFSTCVAAAKTALLETVPQTKRILLIPENHTRNEAYFESVQVLLDIFSNAGFDIRVGRLLSETDNITLRSTGKTLTILPILRKKNKIFIADFIPDVILLNNDLSDGFPALLKNIHQPILPTPHLGWSKRFKSGHFQEYQKAAEALATWVGIDPWLICPAFRYCSNIEFMTRRGEACLIEEVTRLFSIIEEKYAEYGIKQNPFVVIKADAGSYGMGIITVRNPSEIGAFNRKQRTRMSSTKGGNAIHRVIIQEGIYTTEFFENAAAEPVMYLFGSRMVGGFYRVHTRRRIDENLNAPGMHFIEENEAHSHFYTYSVIARLSMLAAARESLMSLSIKKGEFRI